MIADAIFAIHRLVSRRLERKLSDGGATVSAGQVDRKHLTRSARTTAETVGTSSARIAESTVAV
jgi:hypothetical protein